MSESSKSVAEALKEFFESSSEPILFTGAGVSMLAGLPDWRGLLTQMAESVRAADPLTAQQMAELVAAGKLTKAADYYWLSDKVLEGDKQNTLKKILGAYDSAPLKPLASLPFAGILTTNFDRSIHDAIALAKGKSAIDYSLGNANFSSALWETKLHVARIHGCIETPKSMVLSEQQFNVLLDNDVYVELLTQTFSRKSVLFLGFSFYDPAIKYVFEQIDKRFGAATHGRHLAILPEDNSSELVQKANRLNIKVAKYDASNRHQALWDGIAEHWKSLTQAKPGARPAVAAEHPYTAAKQYLAACFARASVSSEHTPLREIVLEGVLSAALQKTHPKAMGLPDLHEVIRKSLGIKGAEVNQLVTSALKSLVNDKLVRKHKEDGVKGARFAWTGAQDGETTLGTAIETLKTSICNRAHVQEGWKPPKHVADAISLFLREIVHKRGWDLGAAFASGKPPDSVSFKSVLAECGEKLAAFDRERIERTLESLFQRPTEEEAALLGELGRISFAVELAFQAPRTTLLHKSTLPRRVYFDANLLMPAFVEGHPHHRTYGDTLARLKTASTDASNRLQLIACRGYLNEIISHKNAALVYVRAAGDDFESLAKSDALYHGPGNINVFIGAYVNSVENGRPAGFDKFLNVAAPYNTETELRRWLESKGLLVVESQKIGSYGALYGDLEKSNAAKLTNGKQPILVEHDALQLNLLNEDYKRGDRALFVTADRQLYEDVSKSKFGYLTEFMVSHVGLVQLVDLLIGFDKVDDRSVGELLWSNKVSEKAQRVRSYLTIEALNRYDAALAMNMHSVVEAQSDAIAKELDREGLDLESHDPTTRVKALKSLGALEAKFFAGMSEAIDRLEK